MVRSTCARFIVQPAQGECEHVRLHLHERQAEGIEIGMCAPPRVEVAGRGPVARHLARQRLNQQRVVIRSVEKRQQCFARAGRRRTPATVRAHRRRSARQEYAEQLPEMASPVTVCKSAG